MLSEDPASLNYLGEIDYYLGDYPAAARRWEAVADLVEEPQKRDALLAKVGRVRLGEVPGHPVIDDLEATGEAMALLAAGEHREALAIMERLEEEGTILAEFPSAQFFYLLGECREKTADLAGAFVAFENALEIDPDFGPAREGKERILDGRSN
jgi:tetratricopeptide (TPR) repeat protein